VYYVCLLYNFFSLGENNILALYSKVENRPLNTDREVDISYIDKSFYSSIEAQRKRSEMRKNIQKQQVSRVKFLVIFFIVFVLTMPAIYSSNFNNLFLRKFANRNLQIPHEMSFVDRAGYMLASNGDFMNTKLLSDVNTKNPLMKSPVLNSPMNRLTSELKYLLSIYPQLQAGIFVWDYNTGNYVDINSDEIFPTASIIKLPILFQMYRRAEKHFLNLDEKLALQNYYVTSGSGFLQYSPLGRKLSYRDLATLMIQESDNTATNMILSSVGGVNELDSEIKRWGLKSTGLSNWLPDLEGTNVSTPKEMGTILYNIGNTDLLSIKARAEIVDIMSHVKNNRLIQAGLPADAGFIHKTGDIGSMLGDAGVVALPDGRKYIAVIFVKRPYNSFAGKEFIVNASKTIYNAYATHSF